MLLLVLQVSLGVALLGLPNVEANHSQAGGSPPQASFSFTPSQPTTGTTVSFQDTSTDPDQDPATWDWSFGDGSTAQGPTPDHAYDDDGTYDVSLTVTDQAGHQDTITRQVQVANRPPAAAMQASATTASPGQTLVFDDASVDPDGTVVDRAWRFGDGAQATGRQVEHAYEATGTYTVGLTVTDDDGATDQTQMTIEVEDRPPEITGLQVPDQAAWYEQVRAEVQATDPDGQALRFTWDLGDGSQAAGSTVTHVYRSPGTHTVQVTATDPSGATANATATIEVTLDPGSTEDHGVLQPLVDQARPGQVLGLPSGSYEEQVQVAKPLVLEGLGQVTIDGGAGPALRLSDGPIEVRNVSLASATSPVVGHSAPALTLWNVTAKGGMAPAMVDVDRLTWVLPPEAGHPEVDASGTDILHGHPVTLSLTYEDGATRPETTVTVLGDGRVLDRVESRADGTLGTFVLPHEGLGSYTSQVGRTVALVRADGDPVALDPHAGSMVLAVGTAPGGLPGSPATVAVAAVVAAIASIAVAFRVHEGFRRWIWGLIAPLYTRLARTELLDHETREAIHDHLAANPGAHLRKIKRELELSHGTLLHHLKMLEDQDLIRSVKDGMYRRFYLAGQEQVAEPTASTRDRVAGLIYEHPGITNAELAERLETQPNRTHYHVSNLLDDGEIRRERDGRKVRLFPATPDQDQV